MYNIIFVLFYLFIYLLADQCNLSALVNFLIKSMIK